MKKKITLNELRQYQNHRRKENFFLDKIKNLEMMRIGYKSPQITDMPRSSSTTNGLCDKQAQIIDEINKNRLKIKELHRKRAEMLNMIEILPNEKWREILYLYAVEDYSWAEVAILTDKDRTHIYRTVREKIIPELSKYHQYHKKKW